MAYTRVNWADFPSTATPINAANLNIMDIGISNALISGAVVNADINAAAAIAYSKLNLATSILNADVNASAAIAYSKLNLATSIVNADIGAAAAIAISKLADPGSGKVITSAGSGAVAAFPPGHEFDYVAQTSNVSVNSNASPVTVVTGTSVTYDGSTVVLIEFYSPEVQTSTTANDYVEIDLYDGATLLGEIAVVQTPAAASAHVPARTAIRITPSAGAHQYIVKAFRGAATGTIIAGTGTSNSPAPAFIRITKAT